MVTSLLSSCVGQPPRREREDAERALLAAAGDRDCAQLRYHSAESAMNEGRRLEGREDYQEARNQYIAARNMAEEAQREAQANADCLRRRQQAGAPAPVPEADFSTAPQTPPPIHEGEATISEAELNDPNYVLKAVFFAYDSSEISGDNRTILINNAAWINRQRAKVKVVGHCDERGTAEYNLSLGERRAVEVKNHLQSFGVPSNLLSTLSMGAEQPLVRGSGETAWAKNRRAEFLKLN